MWASNSGDCSPSLRDARHLFRRGDYSAALDALKFEVLTIDRLRIESQILYWCNRRSDTVEFIRNGNRIVHNADHDPLLKAIYAACLASTEGREEATEILASLREDAFEDVACYRASAYLALNDYAAAIGVLDAVKTEDRGEMNWFFRGWALAFQGDVAAQIRCSTIGLRLAIHRGKANIALAARFLRILAALAREQMDPEAIAAVEEHHNLDWTDDLLVERFQTLRTLAWAHSMRGEHIRAGEELAAAATFAPGAYHRMLIHLDRAWIAASSHEDVHQRIELCEARRCADNVDWSSAHGEEVGGLLLLARLLAPVDPDLAERYLEFSRSITVASNISFAHGERPEAFRREAAAFVCAARRDGHGTERHGKVAIEIFERNGYRWRSANLGLQLFLTTGDRRWLAYVKSAAMAFPRSFLGAEFERVSSSGRTPLETLTNRQREIVALIRNEGLNNDGIAERLAMSPNTVRIHKQKIYRAFHVSSEFQLLAKLTQLAS